MKVLPLIAIVCAVVFSSALLSGQGGGAPVERNPNNQAGGPFGAANPNGPVGRYQMVSDTNPSTPRMWVIDTTTGESWYRSATSGGAGNWSRAGNPAQNPGPK